MNKAILIERDFQDGERLILELDRTGFSVHSAFWLFNSEEKEYRLVIASSQVDSLGYIGSYMRIMKVIDLLPPTSNLGLLNISIVKPSERLISLMSQAIQTPPDAIAGIRFSKNTIGNKFIEDAYIYRLQPSAVAM